MESATTNATNSPPQEPSQSDATEIGWLFVEEYYTFMHKDPARLHCFYNRKSIYTSGKEGETVTTSHGPEEIQTKISELNLEDCKVLVTNVDSQASKDRSIIIQVLGQMANRGEDSRKFAQTFFLSPQPNGYFVLNDILRFLSDDTEEPEAEEAAATEEDMKPADEEASPLPDEKPPGEETSPPTKTLVEEEPLINQQSEPPAAAEEPAPEPITVSKPVNVPDEIVQPPVSATSTLPQDVARDSSAIVATSDEADPITVDTTTSQTKDHHSQTQEESPQTKLGNGQPAGVKENGTSTNVQPYTIQQYPPTTSATVPIQNGHSTYNNEQGGPIHQQQKGSEQQRTWARLAANGQNGQWNRQQLASNQGHVAAAPVANNKIQQPPPQQPITRDQGNRRPDAQRGGNNRRTSDPPNYSIYIKGVTNAITPDDLRNAFSAYGPLKNLDVVHNRQCAFIEFGTPEAYNKVLETRFVQVGEHTVTAEKRRPTVQKTGQDNRNFNQGGYGNQRNQYSQNGMNDDRGRRSRPQDRRNSNTRAPMRQST